MCVKGVLRGLYLDVYFRFWIEGGVNPVQANVEVG